VQRQDEKRGIVLLGEELKRSSIVEGVDIVLLGEALDKGSLDSAEVGDGKLEDLRGLLARNEERGLGVLVLLRLALCHCALCAGILGLAKSAC
jgi:hypothetical protein